MRVAILHIFIDRTPYAVKVARTVWTYMKSKRIVGDGEPTIVAVEKLKEITIGVTETIKIPEAITVTMSDGTRKQVAVAWEEHTIDNSTSGRNELIGTIDGWDEKITCIINIVGKVYDGSEVEQYLEVGTFGYNPNHSGREVVDVTTLINVENLSFNSIQEIRIELMDDTGILASRVATGDQIKVLEGAAPSGKFSCSFVLGGEAGSNSYWTSSGYDGAKPTKVAITITSKGLSKYIAEKTYTGKWRAE